MRDADVVTLPARPCSLEPASDLYPGRISDRPDITLGSPRVALTVATDTHRAGPPLFDADSVAPWTRQTLTKRAVARLEAIPGESVGKGPRAKRVWVHERLAPVVVHAVGTTNLIARPLAAAGRRLAPTIVAQRPTGRPNLTGVSA